MTYILAILAAALAFLRRSALRFRVGPVVLVHGAQREERSCAATRERDEAWHRQRIPWGDA